MWRGSHQREMGVNSGSLSVSTNINKIILQMFTLPAITMGITCTLVAPVKVARAILLNLL